MTDYERGVQAYWAYESYDQKESEQWQEGYMNAQYADLFEAWDKFEAKEE